MNNEFLLIGLDGGATKVNGWTIEANNEEFELGKYHYGVSYQEFTGFSDKFIATDIQRQLKEFQSGKIKPGKKELRQGEAYVEAAAEVVLQLVRKSGLKKVLVGEGMPGLKTIDKRGIAVMANGPRIIDYCDQMEKILRDYNIQFLKPMEALGSDAFYCGIGEEYAREGQFKHMENSYYLGGGTGAADALKLKGHLVSLDNIKEWFVKTWEMKNKNDLSLEKCASAKGIQEIYGSFTDMTVAELNKKEIFPLNIREKALADEKEAIKTFEILAENLALLIYERITTLFAGWQGVFSFVNPNRAIPVRQHPYLGTLLDSIIIGQRLGDLFHVSKDDNLLWLPFFQRLSFLIMKSEVLDEEAKEYYCPGDSFNQKLLVISKLREAPALGAAIDAYLTYRNENNY
ncbi:MAG: hypothetical protein JXQ65_14690 [Candidatus Marinimicrobia bacterium]|nr:hypothetical protein [Candidatus Neomarinimicrobiota bacterium]